MPSLPPALVSRNPLQWLRIFGPGAIIASLTIGTGELIFSSRGGALFGYSILFPFLVICLLKWTLAYSAARHMVLCGVHPLQRWAELPLGPRGWLSMLFTALGVACIPVWVSFHASVLGDFFATLTHTKGFLGGATIHLWGAGVLVATLALSLVGGYAALEKTQLAIVGLMLAAVAITLAIFGPDWRELLGGFFVPRRLAYPDWLAADSRPAVQQIAANPVWVELSLYVGVIGGSSYDYLAYAAYLRDKGWGRAGGEPAGGFTADELRRWTRAPLIDCTLSFAVVLAFSAVFVTAGKLILGPQRQLPGDGAFLEHQAQLVTAIHPWLYPLYAVGVFLAMIGTLYGTLEIMPTIVSEGLRAVRPATRRAPGAARLRKFAVLWCAGAALAVLGVSFAYQLRAGASRPPGLTAVLAPVNLFTGVFGCGLICLLNPWMDRRLPRQLRMPAALVVLNLLGAAAFVLVGLRAYWEYARWTALGVLLITLAAGLAFSWAVNRRLAEPSPIDG